VTVIPRPVRIRHTKTVQIASTLRTQEHAAVITPSDLLLEHFLDLPDLFFNFAGPVFGFAFCG
jgi:hypothetical protein